MKLQTMAKRNFWTGILAIVLVFGMTAIACDNGTTNGNGGNGRTDPALNGTWDGTGYFARETLILNNGNFEVLLDGTPIMRGTFSTSGSTITFVKSHIHSSFLAIEWGITVATGFHTRAEIRTAMIADGMTPAEADEYLAEMFTVHFDTFNVTGNTLTLNGDTYTRRP